MTGRGEKTAELGRLPGCLLTTVSDASHSGIDGKAEGDAERNEGTRNQQNGFQETKELRNEEQKNQAPNTMNQKTRNENPGTKATVSKEPGTRST